MMYIGFSHLITLLQCRFNAGPPSLALANIHSTLGSALCFLGATRLQSLTMDRMHAPIPVQCWANLSEMANIDSVHAQYSVLEPMLD